MSSGWIKLHRQLLDHPLAKKPHYAWLWTTLLLMANHGAKEFIWNKKVQVCEAGQILTGRTALALQTGISASTIEDILNFLETQQQIRQQKTTKFRLITIVKWKDYQLTQQEIRQQTDNKATTEQQQTDTNKNEKNYKNEKNSSEVGAVAPTPSQIADKFFTDDNQQEAMIGYLVSKGSEEGKTRAEMNKFIDYWTEPNATGKKARWQMEKTFDVKRRLIRWFGNSKEFNPSRNSSGKEAVFIS